MKESHPRAQDSGFFLWEAVTGLLPAAWFSFKIHLSRELKRTDFPSAKDLYTSVSPAPPTPSLSPRQSFEGWSWLSFLQLEQGVGLWVPQIQSWDSVAKAQSGACSAVGQCERRNLLLCFCSGADVTVPSIPCRWFSSPFHKAKPACQHSTHPRTQICEPDRLFLLQHLVGCCKMFIYSCPFSLELFHDSLGVGSTFSL